jgi:hypothetical protein
MPLDVLRTLDFGNARKVINLPDPTADQDAATKRYVDSAVEGLAWKDSCRVSTQGNLAIASPGAAIDGVTMVSGDRVLVRAQTAGAENGIYVWNGAAVPMTRALDANSAAELEQATVSVEEGTNASTTWRQTAVNFTLGSGGVAWAAFGTAAPSASETSAGIAEIATQAETDAGADDLRFVTALKLRNSPHAKRAFNADFGDGSATSYTITHNLGTRDVNVEVYRNSGNFDTVLAEVQRPSINAITIIVDTPPTANAFRARIVA